MPERLSPLQAFMAAFALSSLGGLAALLRGHKPLSVRIIVSAMLYSGLLGLIIALLWWNYWEETNSYFLLGVSGLAGIGGTTVADFIIQVIKKGGVQVVITPQDTPPPPPQPREDDGDA